MPATTPAQRANATQALLADTRLWRAASLGASSSPCIPSGFATLDAELPGGGWPTGMLSELLLAHASCEWRLLGPALGALLAGKAKAKSKTVLLINPERMPHLPGLRQHGISPEQLVWIAPEPGRQQARQSLWATEQAIKSQAAAAILAWLPELRPEQMRRLQAAAQGSPAPVFVMRPLSAQLQSSAAPLRLLLATDSAWQLQVHILKRRGPAHEGWLDLPSIPTELDALLTPRMRAAPPGPSPAPTLPRAPQEPAHALARALVPAVQR